MSSPEVMEDIQRAFRARQSAVTRCYSDAANAGTLVKPRARGRVTIVARVTTAGRASEARVAESTLAEPAVEKCIVAKVSEWDLPHPEVDFDFSFTYELQPD